MEQRLIEILKISLEYQVSDIHFDITNGKKEKMNIEMRIDGQMKQLIPKEDDIRLFYYLKSLFCTVLVMNRLTKGNI